MKIIDVMLDLETLSLGNTPVILQVAAVAFKLETGDCLEEFNMPITPKSCLEAGLEISAETISWWLKQSSAAISKVILPSLSTENDLKTVLESFSRYINTLKAQYETKHVRVWGNGLLADNKWLESAYAKVGLPLPYNYSSNSDVRTLVDLGMRLGGPNFKSDTPFEGERHDALADCKHQIKYCHAIYRNIQDGVSVSLGNGLPDGNWLFEDV